MLLKNPNTQDIKEVKVGFSWTTLLFTHFVPLCRGDFTWFFIMLSVNFVGALVSDGILNIITAIAFGATYNKVYIRKLYDKGWRGLEERDHMQLTVLFNGNE